MVPYFRLLIGEKKYSHEHLPKFLLYFMVVSWGWKKKERREKKRERQREKEREAERERKRERREGGKILKLTKTKRKLMISLIFYYLKKRPYISLLLSVMLFTILMNGEQEISYFAVKCPKIFNFVDSFIKVMPCATDIISKELILAKSENNELRY